MAIAACICARNEEMLELFKEHEEAVWNTGKIADHVQFKFETGKLFSLNLIPEEHTKKLILQALSRGP